jgi:hypothetical protein
MTIFFASCERQQLAGQRLLSWRSQWGFDVILCSFVGWPLRAQMAALLGVASLLPLDMSSYVDLRQTQAQQPHGTKNLLVVQGGQMMHMLDSFHRGFQPRGRR